jgi:acetyl-CoA C-acetyltransferase
MPQPVIVAGARTPIGKLLGALASVRDLGVSQDRVNVNGGAIPVGMSGARLALTLALELRRRGGGTGAAALCGGGGQGDALILRVPEGRA